METGRNLSVSVLPENIEEPMLSNVQRPKVPIYTQVIVLLERSFKNTIRDRLGFLAKIIWILCAGLFWGALFYKMNDTPIGIYSREAFLYSSISTLSYTICIASLLQYSEELPAFDRELSDGFYDALPYWISTKLTSFLFEILTPSLFVAVSYFMTGLDPSAAKFFTS